MPHELVLFRRKHALTQAELADLIGISQTSVARLEDENTDKIYHLRLETAFGLQVVFGKSPGRLFARLAEEVEDAVMRRAAMLDRALDGRRDQSTEHKRALLVDMVRRAANRIITP